LIQAKPTLRRFKESFLTLAMHLLAPDTSTFLILTVHLTGRIADGLAALLNAIDPRGQMK